MSAIKKSLVGNLFVLFRNGIIGTTISFPNSGVYIKYTDANGAAILEDADFENYDKFKPRQMPAKSRVKVNYRGEYDIIRLYKPHNPVSLIDGEVQTEQDLLDHAKLVWHEVTEPPSEIKSNKLEVEPASDASNTINDIVITNGGNNNSEITVRTRMFITVNGKEIDPNNLTDNETSILQKLGLL